MSQATITTKELNQGDYITRTVKATELTVKLINLDTDEITLETVTLSGDFDPVYCGRTVEKKFGDSFSARGLKFIKCTAAKSIEKRYAMSVKDFVANGMEIVSASEA